MPDTTMYARGQIYWRRGIDNSVNSYGIHAKDRPILIVSNNIGNNYSSKVNVVPLTSSFRGLLKPTNVKVSCNGVSSYVICEECIPLHKSHIGEYIATVLPEKMKEIDLALGRAFGLFELSGADFQDDTPFLSATQSEAASLIPDVVEPRKTTATVNKKSEVEKLAKNQRKNSENTNTYHKQLTDDQKLQFLVDYDSAHKKPERRQELLLKWKYKSWSVARQAASRFSKKLGL